MLTSGTETTFAGVEGDEAGTLKVVGAASSVLDTDESVGDGSELEESEGAGSLEPSGRQRTV